MARNLARDFDDDEFEPFEKLNQKKIQKKSDTQVRQQRKDRARQRTQEQKDWERDNG